MEPQTVQGFTTSIESPFRLQGKWESLIADRLCSWALREDYLKTSQSGRDVLVDFHAVPAAVPVGLDNAVQMAVAQQAKNVPWDHLA